MTKMKTIGEKLKEFRESKGLNVKEFARLYDLVLANLYKWEKGTQPNQEDYLKLERIISSNGKSGSSVAPEQPKREVSSIETMSTIAESNKIIAESNRILAEANEKLVVSNANLVSMLIDDSPSNIYSAAESKWHKFLELLAEVASGKRFDSKEEAIASMGTIFSADDNT